MSFSIFRITRVLLTSAVAAVLPMGVYAADAFPSKPVRIIVPFAAGGPGDILARLVASEMSNTLGQSVIVDNKPGANGEPGTVHAARSASDGYTVLQVSTVQTVSMALQKKLGYDLLRDFEPVSYTFEAPLVLLTPGVASNNTTTALIGYAKSKPEGISYGSGGVGTVGHLTAEMFKREAGINAIHVPYKGNGAAVSDLIGNRLDYFFATVAESASNVKSGRLHALAVTTKSRDRLLPDVPTMAESGFPDLSPLVSWGFMVPKHTPSPVIARLQDAIAKAVASPDLQERLKTLGVTIHYGGAAMLESSIQKDLALWKKTIKEANIQPE